MALALLAFGALGHMVLWVALINRVHALGIARHWVKLMTLVFLAMLAFAPLAVLAALFMQFGAQSFAARLVPSIAWAYVYSMRRSMRRLGYSALYWSRHPERAAALLTNHTSHIGLRDRLEAMAARGVPALVEPPARQPGAEHSRAGKRDFNPAFGGGARRLTHRSPDRLAHVRPADAGVFRTCRRGGEQRPRQISWPSPAISSKATNSWIGCRRRWAN